ncbi:MAG TPA: hypothetical protein VGK32_03340 [Vicinamibacterales bacterium]|jgi:hypothetical protein
MRGRDFWKAVTVDQSEFLDELVAILSREPVDYCVIGGQAVNAYVEPLVSLDLDLVVAADALSRIDDLFGPSFQIERFPYSVNLAKAGSDLRVQIQTDPRYAEFLARAERRLVLGVSFLVAAVDDVLRGKVWAALDEKRRPSKRQKDLADISRLLERFPELRTLVPPAIGGRLL